MAIIGTPISDAVLTVDPTSKAMWVTQYNGIGQEVPHYEKSFITAPGLLRYSAIMPAFIHIFAVRNNWIVPVFIKKISIWTSFDGTAASSSQVFIFRRFNSATPSGGAANTAINGEIKKKNRTMDPTQVLDIRWADLSTTTGLGVVGLSLEEAFARGVLNRNSGAITRFVFNYNLTPHDRLQLAYGEGFSLSQLNDAVAGDAVQISVEWEEGT